MEEIINNEQEIRIAMSSSIEENIRKVYEATKKGCIEGLKTLMEEDPYLIQNVVTSSSNNNQTHPLLRLSISLGHFEFTRLLLHHNPQLAAEVDSLQRTPLHLASKLGDMDIVQALLEKNMSACFVYDNKGLIPLHYAVISGQMDIMQELIKARPRSLWMKLHNNGQTVLHLCVENNHLEGMKLLIETYVNDDEDFLNTADDKGNTILDLSLMLRQSEMVEYLVSIPEVKTRTKFAASTDIIESTKSQKMKKARNPKKQRGLGSASLKGIGFKKLLKKKLEYKGDWVQEVQGTMMLVATVIATVTFQGGVNPPGGVWQEDTRFNYSSFKNDTYPSQYVCDTGFGLYSHLASLNNGTIVFPAGTAVLRYQQSEPYWVYLWINTISFFASMSVILMIVGRFPLKNRICSWLLALAMCIAVVSLAIGYILGVGMVNLMFFCDYLEPIIFDTFFVPIICWLGVVGVVGLWQLTHFLKTLFHIFKSHSFKRNSTRFFQRTS